MLEKSYEDFCPSAKKGIQKYVGLSSSAMVAYQRKYFAMTGRSATHIDNKEDFYSWVSRNTIRRKAR